MTRIVDLRLGHVHYDEGRPPIAWGHHRFARSVLVARVIADNGCEGVGVAWCRVQDGAAYARATLEPMRDAILGTDARLPHPAARACQEVALRPGIVRAASVVELALWDLAGRTLDVPCCQLLGCMRASIPAYAISAEEFGYTEDAQYVALAQRFVQQGYRGCKFHLTGNPERDIGIARAIRDAVGRDVTLMLDPAGRYDRAGALRAMQALAELGFDRIEDPIPAQDFEGYRWLARHATLAVAANDPMLWGPRDCADAAREGLVRILRLDPGRAGIVASLAMSAMAQTHGIDIDFSALAPFGGVEACLHLALAADRARWFEHHFASGLDEVPGAATGVTVKEGRAFPSDLPGWGVAVDWTELDRHCTWAA